MNPQPNPTPAAQPGGSAFVYTVENLRNCLGGLFADEERGFDRAILDAMLSKLATRANAHDQLVAALERARDHLIMSGIKQTDAPEALEQARSALAAAK